MAERIASKHRQPDTKLRPNGLKFRLVPEHYTGPAVVIGSDGKYKDVEVIRYLGYKDDIDSRHHVRIVRSEPDGSSIEPTESISVRVLDVVKYNRKKRKEERKKIRNLSNGD